MPPLRTLLEIEQKFLFNPALVPLFRANLGKPPFRSIVQPHPAVSSFRDVYYDGKGGELEKEGIWLRKREGKGWEVKQRLASASASASPILLSTRDPTGGGQGGRNHPSTTTTISNENNENSTYLRSTFIELNSLASIHRLIRTNFGPNVPGPEQNFGLEVLCDFRTDREHATVDDDFAVVLDRTCFGHAVGEVELIAGGACTGMNGDDPAEGHQRIDDFMRKYAWFFGGGGRGGKKIKGKLSAYFERFGVGMD